jgi:transposase
VGLDVAKRRHAVAIAEEGREGEVRFLGEIGSDPSSVRRLATRLEKQHAMLHFCYEAGPTGYGLYRQLTAIGHRCTVVAPSMIPRRPGDRIETNRRDALQLARLLRTGELTAVWVPDEAHEAVRELIRSREAAVDDCVASGRLSPLSCCAADAAIPARRPGAHGTANGYRRSD